MAVLIEGVILDEVAYPVPHLPDWLRVLRISRHEAARRMGYAQPNLVAALSGRIRLRGRYVSAFAETVDIPAEVFVYFSPFDAKGRKWARRAIMAEVEQRLTREPIAV